MSSLMDTTEKWKEKSLLEKGRIQIISHYSGMPRQLAQPNPGTSSASSHLWNSVKRKQRDQPGFQIQSNVQLTFSVPRPAWGLLHQRSGPDVWTSKRTLWRGGRQRWVARTNAFKIVTGRSGDLNIEVSIYGKGECCLSKDTVISEWWLVNHMITVLWNITKSLEIFR